MAADVGEVRKPLIIGPEVHHARGWEPFQRRGKDQDHHQSQPEPRRGVEHIRDTAHKLVEFGPVLTCGVDSYQCTNGDRQQHRG